MNDIKKYLWSFRSIKWDLLLIILLLILGYFIDINDRTQVFLFSVIGSSVFIVKDFIEDRYIQKFIKK